MNKKNRFYIVDVFTKSQYSGNQLAVIVVNEAISDVTMQQIAAEINFSETTFVTPVLDNDGGYHVRVFTPAREVAFTGHPILGTAWVIRHYVSPEPCTQVQLNIAVGQVSVTFENSENGQEVVWFTAPRITLGETSTVEPFATALGLKSVDIETELPIQMISAGTSATIVPLNNINALRRSKLNLDAFSTLLDNGFPPLVYLFCRQTRDSKNNISARFFFEAHGVREDPATGNGAAFLGAYLLEHQKPQVTDLSIRIEQGYEVRRPSLVMLKASVINGNNEIQVGGHIIETMQGELL